MGRCSKGIGQGGVMPRGGTVPHCVQKKLHRGTAYVHKSAVNKEKVRVRVWEAMLEEQSKR